MPTTPMKVIFIAKVLLTKRSLYVHASVLSILCLPEPRTPSNVLGVKYTHKSTQETSRLSSPALTWLKAFWGLRTVLMWQWYQRLICRFGNVPMESAFRSPSPRWKHLQGWMMSWVPFPKVSLLIPPPYSHLESTLYINPSARDPCPEPPEPLSTATLKPGTACSPGWTCWSFPPLPCCCCKRADSFMRADKVTKCSPVT